MINLLRQLPEHPEKLPLLASGDLFIARYDCPGIKRRECFLLEQNCIVFVCKGQVFFRSGNALQMGEGSCALLKKGGYKTNIEWGACTILFIFIPDNFLKRLFRNFCNPDSTQHLPIPLNDRVLMLELDPGNKEFFYFLEAVPCLDGTPSETGHERKCGGLLRSILTNPKNQQAFSVLKARVNARRQSIQEVMNENYAFGMDLNQYARLSGRSLSTFKREFRNIYRCTPGKWILDKRLVYASRLLESQCVSIKEVAFECGFENQTHFSRVFAKKNGFSPLRFRQRLNGSIAQGDPGIRPVAGRPK